MNSTDNPQPLTFGSMVPAFDDTDEFLTPATIEIGARIFYYEAARGSYQDIIGIDLYIEPGLNDLQQTLTQDSYWEFSD